jgi:hypothetical protein
VKCCEWDADDVGGFQCLDTFETNTHTELVLQVQIHECVGINGPNPNDSLDSEHITELVPQHLQYSSSVNHVMWLSRCQLKSVEVSRSYHAERF